MPKLKLLWYRTFHDAPDTCFCSFAGIAGVLRYIWQGQIPSTISKLVTLEELNMSYNLGVVGELPLEIGGMSSLTSLHLYSAGIHGENRQPLTYSTW